MGADDVLWMCIVRMRRLSFPHRLAVSGRLGSNHPTGEPSRYYDCYYDVGTKKRQVHSSVLPVARKTEQWDMRDGQSRHHWSVAQAV